MKRGLQSFKIQNKQFLRIVKDGYQKVMDQVMENPSYNFSSPQKADIKQAFSQCEPKTKISMIKKKIGLIKLNQASGIFFKRQNTQAKTEVFAKKHNNSLIQTRNQQSNYCIPLERVDSQSYDKDLRDEIQKLRQIKQQNSKIEQQKKQSQITKKEKITKSQRNTPILQYSTKKYRYALAKNSTSLYIPRVQRIKGVQTPDLVKKNQMRFISQAVHTQKEKNNINNDLLNCYRQRKLSSFTKFTEKKVPQHKFKFSGFDIRQNIETIKFDSQPTIKSLMNTLIVQRMEKVCQ